LNFLKGYNLEFATVDFIWGLSLGAEYVAGEAVYEEPDTFFVVFDLFVLRFLFEFSK
jgi:hypothetical protein